MLSGEINNFNDCIYPKKRVQSWCFRICFRKVLFMGTIDRGDIGGRQQMILQCIWDLGGEAIVSQIQERLEKEYDVKITGQGINTTINLLLQKGLLRRERKIRQSFIYETTMSQEEFRMNEIRRIKNRSFGGSCVEMIAVLLKDGVTKEEVSQIKKLIKNTPVQE